MKSLTHAVLFALLSASAAAQTRPSGVATQDVERALADALIQSKQMTEARVVVERMMSRHPEDAELKRTLVWLREQTGDVRGALNGQRELVRFLGAAVPFADRMQLIRLQRKGGERAQAAAALSGLSIPPGLPTEETLELAELYLEVGDARRSAELIGGLDPRDLDRTHVLRLAADIATRRGDHASAARMLERLRGRPDAPAGLEVALLSEWSAAGERGKALALARTLSLERLKDDEVLAIAQLALEARDLALAHRAVAAIPPGRRTATVELVRAELARLEDKLAEALAILDAAVRRYSADARLVRALAGALLDSGEPVRALALIVPLADGPRATLEDLAIALRARHAVHDWRAGDATALRLAKVAAKEAPKERVRAAAALAFEQKPQLALGLLERTRGEAATTAWRVPHARASYDDGATGQQLAAALAGLNARELSGDQALAMAELAYRAGLDQQVRGFCGLLGDADRSLKRRGAALEARAVWRMTGDPRAAADAAERALALHREEDGPALDVAGLLMEAHRFDEARAALARFPVKKQQHALRAAYLRLAWELGGSKDYDDARALPVDPFDPVDRDPFTDLDLAGLELERGRPDAARELAVAAAVPPWGRVRQEILIARANLASRGRLAAKQSLHELANLRAWPEDDRLDVADALLSIPAPNAAQPVVARCEPAGALVWKKQVLESRRLVREANFGEAFALLRTMMPGAVSGPWTRRRDLANILIEARRPEAGRKLAAPLPEWWWKTYDGRKMLAGFAILERRGQDVMDRATRLLGERAGDADAAHLHAQGRLLLRHWPEALAEHDALIARSPEREEYHLGRAQALLGLDRAPEGLAVTTAFVHRAQGEDQPVSLNTELALAQALNQADRPKEALAIQDRILGLIPDDANLIKERAGTLAYLDRHAEAVRELDRAAALTEKLLPSDHVQRGASVRWTQGRDAARAEYEKALALDPRDRDALRSLATLQAENPDLRDEAIETYHRLLAVDPLDIGRVGLASVLIDLGHPELAAHELARVRARVPSNRELGMTTISWRLARVEPNAAHRQWRELVASRPLDPGAWIALAQIDLFQGAGFRKEAVRAAEYARQLTPNRVPIVRQADMVTGARGLVSHEFEDGSDTLRRERTTLGLAQAQLDHGAVEAGLVLEQNKLQRLGNREEWLDAHARASWNPANEHAVNADLTVGEVDGRTDVLPAVEYRYTPRRGLWGAAGLARERVIDAPEALQAGLRQERLRVSGGKAWGRTRHEIGATVDLVNDGNTRRQYYSRNRWTVHGPFVLAYDFEYRSSEFEPDPFNLYFAPGSYRQHVGGIELLPLFWGRWQVGGRIARLLDNLNGLAGEGSVRSLNASRLMGGRNTLNLNVSHLENSVARRIGNVDQPYRQTSANVSYNWQL